MWKEYIGSTDFSIFNKNQRPVDMVDMAARRHDAGYFLKGSNGIGGALFDLSVLKYDKQLFLSSQITSYGYILGGKDPITNRPISFQTAARAWAVSAAFGPITVGKRIANGIYSIPDTFSSFTSQLNNYFGNFYYYYNQQIINK